MRNRGFTPIVIPLLVVVVVLLGFIYLSQSKRETHNIPSSTQAPNSNIGPTNPPIPLSSLLPNSKDNKIYNYGTFTFSYPKTWKLTENTTDSSFFNQNKISGFGHMILLQNGDFYLLITIDTPPSGAEVGGLFISDDDYKEYLNNYDQIAIQGNKFFLWKNHTSLTNWNDPNREAGVYSLASLSKYIPNKVANNNQGKSFNGYDQYFQEGESSYMFIKLSKAVSGVTPYSIQSDLQGILESIKW